ncbi:hypothetical protein IRJ41_007597 [Triplophysa rosa]|uniref:Ubiquitin-like protease family profile domain-containing protein n=1 Tax=Triplophysa rosa TaxID=992332 RepID=A0A9W7T2Z5_TRIRA|nr:hypothetical protein IRJ41_007597 [Triplophysa rosa]
MSPACCCRNFHSNTSCSSLGIGMLSHSLLLLNGSLYLLCTLTLILASETSETIDPSQKAPAADQLYGDADFIFQQDLAPAHSAKATSTCNNLENGNHWTLFLCDLKKQAITYMDPFGEEEEKKNDILMNWSSFAKAKGCSFKWSWTDVPHPRQEDGHSCGVHVLMFAQALLDGQILVEGYTSVEIPQLRAQFCYTLFNSLVYSTKCTVCWGVLTKDKVIRSIQLMLQ